VPVAPAVGATMGVANMGLTPEPALAGVVAGSAMPPPIAPVLPTVTAFAMPRAGFWIRFAAMFIDLILVGVAGLLIVKLELLALATYAALMWKFRGTTVGGIICGLKVVRLDG